jgi:hypothetical protein
MSDPQFDTYRKILALAQANPTISALRAAMAAAKISLDQNEPISGFFRHAEYKGGPLEPLAITRTDENGKYCATGKLEVLWGDTHWIGDEARVDRFWPYCAWRPVSYEDYATKMDGKEWPDIHVLVAEPLDGIEEIAGRSEENPGPGHNSNATPDELAELAGRISEARAGVKQYATITSDEQRAQSQTLRSTLLELFGTALKRRTALSRPHLDALEVIRGKWTPLVDGAQDGANAVKKAQEAWGTVKLHKQQEEDRRIEAARKEQERITAEQAVAAQAAVDAGQAPPDPVPQALVPEAPRLAPQTSFKGGTGRAAHEKRVTVITEVTDWPALYLYFIQDQVVREYIRKRADMFLKSTGEIPPGCITDIAAKVA